MWDLVVAFFACTFLIDWLDRRGRTVVAVVLCFPVALVISVCVISRFLYA